MFKRIVAAALLLALAPGAQAQDGSEGMAMRTPAGAQRFLERLSEQGQVVVRVNTPTGQEFGIGDVRFVPEGDCVTRLEFPILATAEYGAKIEAGLAQLGLPRPPYHVDWRTVTDLQRTNIACSGCGPQEPRFFHFQNFTIWLPSVSVADRVDFALKYLVERCGLPEVEGF